MITEERKRALLNSIEKLEAYQELQNLMGRTVAAVNFRQPEKILENFALDREDVSLEFADEGVFEGKEGVTAVVKEIIAKPPKKGEMVDMQLTTPMIEVAGDGNTAEALWWCPGAGAVVSEKAEPQAIWAWGMLAADFIKEKDQWKIWHLHYFRYIKCFYEKGWVEDTTMIHRPNLPMHPLAKPSTYHNPYSPNSVRDGLPACPRPYETYQGTGWMLNRDKTR
ncbi:MAG TPA: nuclear transport factor 2 family protein [Candidatus Choladousia intestinavium]|uniref:Nuclear transport factor 2 family protein n=1 Tax=Candidatus Choladousia intestinavium TaxID=2840727 RepID=A0A9D1D909_9FIRM|nr:nuclear transport factor 2 family protein [Candidatus Choladousia intestinavium]